MGILGTVVIPLVQQAMRDRAASRLQDQKQDDQLELIRQQHLNMLDEIAAKGREERETVKTQTSSQAERYKNEYARRLLSGIATSTAGGIAAGAAKGYFSSKFAAKSKENKDNNNHKPQGPSSSSTSIPLGTFTPDQIQKAKDFFNPSVSFGNNKSFQRTIFYPANMDVVKQVTEQQSTADKLAQELEKNRARNLTKTMVLPGISGIAPVLTII